MILTTMNGVAIQISPEEANGIAKAIQQRAGHVTVRGALIPTSTISLIPDQHWGENANHGRLHDGTRVIRKYGRWCDAGNPDIHIDPSYYPELMHDDILTEVEWNTAGLSHQEPGAEREQAYAAMIQQRKQRPDAHLIE